LSEHPTKTAVSHGDLDVRQQYLISPLSCLIPDKAGISVLGIGSS